MAVAAMHRMQTSNDPAATARDFAFKLQDKWGVGDPACDNGVLILMSELEDQLVVATGAAVAILLPQDVLAAILRDVHLELAQHRYGAAMELAATRIGLALADAVRPHDDPSPGGGGGGSGGDGGGHHTVHWGLLLEELLLAFGCISAAVGAVYQHNRRRARARRQYEECRSSLEGIQRDNLALLQGQGQGAAGAPPLLSDCPMCLAHLDFSCTPSGPHFALTVRARASDETGSDTGGPNADSDVEEEEAEEEDSLRQPLCRRGADAGAGAGPEDSAAVAAVVEQRPGVMFPCGHAFCRPCIAGRLKRRLATCPVCNRGAEEGLEGRGDVTTGNPGAADAGAAAASNPVPAGSSGGGGSGSGGSDERLLARLRERWEARLRDGRGLLGPPGGEVQFPVLIFRLRQLQREHPQLLPLEMTRVWEQDLREGRELDAQQLRAFQRRDPGSRRDGALGTWPLVQPHLAKLRGLRFWRTRR